MCTLKWLHKINCLARHLLLVKADSLNYLEVLPMKKILSTLVAAIVALSFSAVVFAADATPAAGAKPAVEKKEVKKVKKANKVKKAQKVVKREAAETTEPAAK
jgi:hypothetical protein